MRAQRPGPDLLGGGGAVGHGVGGRERGIRLLPAAHVERRRTKTEERVHLLLPRLRVRESGLAGAEGLCGISLPEERALSHGKRVIQAPLVRGGLERASGPIDLPERFGVVPAAAVELPGHEPRPRLGAACLRWQPVQPGAQPLSGQALQPGFAASCDDAESVKRLVGVQVELHCHLCLADILERGRRLVLEAAERRLAFFLEVSLPQEVAEEVVVAVRALLARREGEDAVRRKMSEVAVRRVRAGKPVSELGVDVFEAARALEEGADGLVLAPVHLLREVGVDVLLEAGVREGQLQRVEVEPLEGQAGEHDARRPALGERDQALDVLAARLVAGACGEHRHGLLRVEAQSLGAYRSDVAGETHLVHRERGIVSREHDETEARREIGQQVVQRAIELRRLGRLVVVVEDDVDIAVDPSLALLDEHRLHVLDGEGGLGSGPQAFADRVAEVREALSEGFGERREEDDGVVVEDVQLVPDAVETQALDGRRGDCGLAVAGGRADQRQPSSCGPPEVRERVGAQDDVVYAWAGEFRRDRAWS